MAIKARVRAQVTLDIEMTSVWDAKTEVGKIHQDAAEGAFQEITHLLEAKAKGSKPGEMVIPDPSVYERIRVVGIKTTAISTEMEKG